MILGTFRQLVPAHWIGYRRFKYRSRNVSLSLPTQFVQVRFPHHYRAWLLTHLLSKWCVQKKLLVLIISQKPTRLSVVRLKICHFFLSPVKLIIGRKRHIPGSWAIYVQLVKYGQGNISENRLNSAERILDCLNTDIRPLTQDGNFLLGCYFSWQAISQCHFGMVTQFLQARFWSWEQCIKIAASVRVYE
jgi:hypothetical protein